MDATTPVPVPAATLADQVRKVLTEAVAPLAFADVKKALKAAGVPVTGKKKVSDEEIQRELSGAGVHVHPPAKAGGKPKFWHRAPLTMEEQIAQTVRGKVASLGDEPVKPSKANFGKPSGAEALAAFEAVLKQLIAEGLLFAHPGGKYGKKAPPKPKWHEVAPHKAEFAKIVAAARKVLAQGDVTADELFATLRHTLARTEPVVHPEPKLPAPTPAPVTPAPVTPTQAATVDLRTALKQAYEHLCLFVEFRDKLVELPRLYHETLKRFPTLTAEAFQHELWQMNEERLLGLQVLNEVVLAKEPHLAIHRNDRLYYFARWK